MYFFKRRKEPYIPKRAFFKFLLAMKLTAFLLLVACIHVSARGFSQKIVLSVKDAPLSSVFESIEQQSGYSFFYDKKILRDLGNVTANFHGKSLKQILDAILPDQSLTYEIVDKIIVIRNAPDYRSNNHKLLKHDNTLFNRSFATNEPRATLRIDELMERMTRSHYKEIVIRGKVTDEKGEALPGVNVLVKGTQQGTVTNLDGSYSISVPDQNSVLVFSFVGYITKEIMVGPNTNIDLSMLVDDKALEEVVVVGYGTQKKVNMTGAVGVIEPKNVENRPVASAMEALQGQVAGLNVVRPAGQPGNQNFIFRIRGISTFTSNPVLTLIDGVPSSLDRINPNDIESISVLKDAASAAIYGTRASGGVILVTTKSGKSGKPRISISSSVGIQTPTRFPKKVSALDHALLSNEARANDGGSPKYSQDQIAMFSSPDWEDTDWDSYMLKKGIQTNQNISIAGGGESHDYYISLGYLNQDGIVINTGYERFNLQMNHNVKLTNRLKLGIRTGIIPSTRIAPAANYLSNMLSFVAAEPNIDKVKTADGRWLQNTNNTGGGNAIALASTDGGQQILRSNRLQGNFSLDYEILRGLKLSGIYGVSYTQSRQRDYRKKVTLYRQDNHDQIASTSQFNYLDINNSSEIFQNLNFLANYEKSLGLHQVTLMGGTTAEWFYSGNDQVSTRDFLTDDIYTISAGSSNPSMWFIAGGASDWSLASVIARGTYAFKNRYLLESSFRYDGSSRFAKGLKWGFFPSVSVGWILSDEEFLKNDVLTYLKLRGSWGKVGNQNVGFYPFANTLTQTSYYFNGAARRGVTTGGAPNPELTWETKVSYNLGVDGSFWNNILEFSFDVFKERTSDILLQLPLPTTFGQAEPVQNVGIIDNRGWELEIRHRKNIKDFSYGLSFQLSDARNKVIDMGGVGPIISNNTITDVGHPMNEWFGWRAIGLFQTQEEINNAPFQTVATSPGDIRYQENGGDPNAINSDDRVRLGNSDPRFPYGIRADFGYKHFSLRLFGQGLLRHLVWNNGWTAHNFDRENSTLRTYHLDRWTPDTPNAKYPKTRMGSGANRSGINDSFSSFWLEDAAYFRLKHIELGYDLPSNLLNRLKIKSARLYMSGENLLTFTQFPGYDPESPTGTAARLVESRYPLAKIYNVGLNFTF